MTIRRWERPFWWWLDYVYAGWQQARSLLKRRRPDSFAEGSPELPAVILLPGVYETWLFLEPLARRLNASGHRVFAVPELGLNRMPITRSAEVVAVALARLSAEHGLDRVILLAHSKGGLIGKQLMATAAAAPLGLELVGMVAVSTPFSGSSYARFLPTSTLRAFSPQDEVLQWLAGQRNPNGKIVSVYAEFDPHIPDKSALDGALNIEMPIAGHFLPLGNRLLGETVERAVSGLLRAPQPPVH
ncbi:esterase/lipase family protein [Microterricola pindariensis]|uniref:Alpha/beta hydrolase n=1 Tax=Microterricola pindariensis TaxID=478010 RepID=A0ABX5AZ36_9MICO|nr:alpha/beta hydrolase [Microterricola pindariensis]PPL19784.1 hypothetical protein GY24_03975 [Microterricola pindariensis]